MSAVGRKRWKSANAVVVSLVKSHFTGWFVPHSVTGKCEGAVMQ
jgi:hypothetical protein